MAPRPTWSGALQINALLQAHVSLTKGTEDYRGKEGLTELCACHHEPFKRKTVCVEGFTRLTQEMEKAGETDGTTSAVKGVSDGKGGYIPLVDDTLKAIEAAGTSDTIAIAAVLDPEQIPLERTTGLFYVTHDKKVKGAKKAVDLVYGALEQAGKMAVARWAPRGREMLVVIRPIDGRLVASVLLFESEIRDATPHTLSDREVSPDEIDLAIQLLGQLPSEFNFASAEDEAVAVRQQAIAAARDGEPIPTQAPAQPTQAEPDNLMAVLRAAVEAGSAASGEADVQLVASSN